MASPTLHSEIVLVLLLVLVHRSEWLGSRTRDDNEDEKDKRFSWCRRFRAAESDMTHAGVRRCSAACTRAIALAVARIAQKGSSLSYVLVGLVRMSRIPTPGGADRIMADGLARHLHVDIGSIKVTHPIPHIASHVVEPISIWGKRLDRGSPRKSIFNGVLVGKFSGPGVGHIFPFGLKLIPPGITLVLKTASSRKFPLRFRRKALPRPLCIRGRIVPGYLNHRMIFATLNVRSSGYGA
jgi:hypothetical protein